MDSDDGTGASGRLVNGEAVEVDVRVARIGSRMLAFLIDVTLQAVLAWLLVALGTMVLLLADTRVTVSSALVDGLLVVGAVTVFVGYPVALETLSGGRSVGKLAMGLRVVRLDGGPIQFRHALTRALVGAAVEWPGLIIPPLGWLACLAVMIVNPSGRRLGDLAAGTLVLHERTPASWGWVPVMPPPLARWAATLDLTGLDDDLALAVRHFLSRNRRIREPARTRLGYALASDIADRVTPPPPPGTPGWAYLAAVLAERHRRSSARLSARRALSDRIWRGLPGWPVPPEPVPMIRDAIPREKAFIFRDGSAPMFRDGTSPEPVPTIRDAAPRQPIR